MLMEQRQGWKDKFQAQINARSNEQETQKSQAAEPTRVSQVEETEEEQQLVYLGTIFSSILQTINGLGGPNSNSCTSVATKLKAIKDDLEKDDRISKNPYLKRLFAGEIILPRIESFNMFNPEKQTTPIGAFLKILRQEDNYNNDEVKKVLIGDFTDLRFLSYKLANKYGCEMISLDETEDVKKIILVRRFYEESRNQIQKEIDNIVAMRTRSQVKN